MTPPIIIIGSGLAGYTLAREFRKLDAHSPLLLCTRDDGAVYAKPMLSNAFASGKTPSLLVSASAQKIAADLNMQVMTHTEVLAIDATEKTIRTAQGIHPYRALVLALGADPIRPPLNGDAADQALSVNDLADYARFRASTEQAKSVAIIGTGLIGCEFANDLASGGYQVTVIGPSACPLHPMIPRQAGQALATAMEALGVQWRFGVTVVAAHRAAGQIQLGLSDGSTLRTDAVLSAVGLRPRTALAQQAGLHCNRGVVVDTFLRSRFADIYALGDCAEIAGKVMPYVMPIMHAARALAQTLAGTDTAVKFPLMPVVVKTPVYPITVLTTGDPNATWVLQESKDGLQFEQIDTTGKRIGFALTGNQTKRRTAMLATLQDG